MSNFIEGNRIQLEQYKDFLIIEQGYICPVLMEYVEYKDVEILWLNERDWAISRDGLNKLRTKWGAQYINDKLVHAMEYDATEDQVVREKG